MLTDKEINSAIKKNSIKINPYDKKLLESGNYRIRLGKKLLIPKRGKRVSLDSDSDEILYNEYDLERKNYILKPNEFILGQTYEKIGVGKNIAAILDGRSTLARMGVSIHQSSQFIAPGQDFHIITLEIFNAGAFEVELKYMDKVGKLIFFEFSVENQQGYDEYGRYSGQQETTGANLGKNKKFKIKAETGTKLP